MRRTLTAAVVLLCVVASAARGQDEPEVADTHPTFSADTAWVRPMLVGVAGLFAAAGTIGSFVWLRARDTVPAAATHEEDPGADRH